MELRKSQDAATEMTQGNYKIISEVTLLKDGKQALT